MACRPQVALGLAAQLAAGCAISLDDEPAAIEADGGLATPSSCVVVADLERGVLGASGRVSSTVLADGAALIVADRLTLAAAPAIEPAVFLAEPAGAGTCLARAPRSAPPGEALDLALLGDGLEGHVLSTFVVGQVTLAFVQTSVGLAAQGIALATYDAARGRFVAGADYLFTADRPAYGDAALVEDDTVYAYGCQGTGFLTDTCYVARVPASQVGERDAYEYYVGSSRFGSSPDDAWPLFDGGSGLTIARRRGRVVAAYVTPLGQAITVRSGLTPTGPWSGPVEVARCQLPADAFCGQLAAHAQLDGDPDALSVTYAIGSFDPLPAAAAMTRLVQLSLEAVP